MSLADALKQAVAETDKPKTVIDGHLEAMDDEDRQATLDALASKLSNKRLAAALTEGGYPVGASAVGDWRKRNNTKRNG